MKDLISAKHDIYLLGDFNEELGADEVGMIKLSIDLGLIDLMANNHPHLPPVATYARGSKRLDYALATP